MIGCATTDGGNFERPMRYDDEKPDFGGANVYDSDGNALRVVEMG